MNRSLISHINNKISECGIEKKTNTLICSDNEINVQKLIEIFSTNSNKNTIKEEILTNNFFDKNMTLLQNIKFYKAFLSVEPESFISKYGLKEQFEQFKHKHFHEMQSIIWVQYEILLYIFSCKALLIEKSNFFGMLNKIPIDLLSVIKEKEIFYFYSNSSGNLRSIKNFFDVYVFISDNNFYAYDNFDKFFSNYKLVKL